MHWYVPAWCLVTDPMTISPPAISSKPERFIAINVQHQEILISILNLMASFHPSFSRLILVEDDPPELCSENWHLRPPWLSNSPWVQFQWLASLKLNWYFINFDFQLQKVICDYHDRIWWQQFEIFEIFKGYCWQVFIIASWLLVLLSGNNLRRSVQWALEAGIMQILSKSD